MSETPRRVLYVDDDEALRRLVARSLTRRGYDVSLAASGEEGLELASSGRFDVIALDHYMPGMGGFEALTRLLATGTAPPIVYVTGSDESRVAVAALKAGAADYVVKIVGDEFFDLLDQAFAAALEEVALRRKAAEAEEAIRASNQRLQALLREVNHRVANSLQMVSAFVQLQAAALDDEAARSALSDTQRRIEAVVQVHRRLYTSDDVETVDLAAYLEALVHELEQSWSSPLTKRRLVVSAEPVRLDTDRAVSLGVIVNELITNACKYAYAPGAAGDVRVVLALEGEAALRLTVEDDGRGISADDTPEGTGLGARVIRAMADSLGAHVDYDAGHRGVRASVRVAL